MKKFISILSCIVPIGFTALGSEQPLWITKERSEASAARFERINSLEDSFNKGFLTCQMLMTLQKSDSLSKEMNIFSQKNGTRIIQRAEKILAKGSTASDEEVENVIAGLKMIQDVSPDYLKIVNLLIDLNKLKKPTVPAVVPAQPLLPIKVEKTGFENKLDALLDKFNKGLLTSNDVKSCFQTTIVNTPILISFTKMHQNEIYNKIEEVLKKAAASNQEIENARAGIALIEKEGQDQFRTIGLSRKLIDIEEKRKKEWINDKTRIVQDLLAKGSAASVKEIEQVLEELQRKDESMLYYSSEKMQIQSLISKLQAQLKK